jgi:hypothetical protein
MINGEKTVSPTSGGKKKAEKTKTASNANGWSSGVNHL